MNYPLNSAMMAQVAGVSLRQLQWWDERGLLSPNVENGNRRYSLDDALAVALIAELRRRGMGNKCVWKCTAKFTRSSRESFQWMIVDANGNSAFHFQLTDAIDAMSRIGLCILIDITKLRKSVVT